MNYADLQVTTHFSFLRGVLSILEAMSHVLIETLAAGDADFILCYDVPDMPHFSRTALLQDDLVLVIQLVPEPT